MNQYLLKATFVAFFILIGFGIKAQQVRLIGNNGQIMATKNFYNNSVVFENFPPNGEYKIEIWVNDFKKCIVSNTECLTMPNKNGYCKFSGHIIWNEKDGVFAENKTKSLATGKFVCYVERKDNSILVKYYE
jgi:hypothetical protein